MRIPNMCLVLKLNNGKVVSIANEQTHPVLYYDIDSSPPDLFHRPKNKYRIIHLQEIHWNIYMYTDWSLNPHCQYSRILFDTQPAPNPIYLLTIILKKLTYPNFPVTWLLNYTIHIQIIARTPHTIKNRGC